MMKECQFCLFLYEADDDIDDICYQCRVEFERKDEAKVQDESLREVVKECHYCFAFCEVEEEDDGTEIYVCGQCRGETRFQSDFLSDLWKLSQLKKRKVV